MRKYYIVMALFILLTTLFTGCAQPAEEDMPVAEINGKPVYISVKSNHLIYNDATYYYSYAVLPDGYRLFVRFPNGYSCTESQRGSLKTRDALLDENDLSVTTSETALGYLSMDTIYDLVSDAESLGKIFVRRVRANITVIVLSLLFILYGIAQIVWPSFFQHFRLDSSMQKTEATEVSLTNVKRSGLVKILFGLMILLFVFFAYGRVIINLPFLQNP